MASILVDHWSPNIVDPISIDMNEKNSQCDDVGGIEAIEFIHNLSARACARSILTRYNIYRGFENKYLYFELVKHLHSPP